MPEHDERLLKPSTLSPFRYPGGKSWLRVHVLHWIADLGWRPRIFIEPFAGGASVSLAVAECDLADKILMIERDPDVAAVWGVILQGPAGRLASRIRSFRLSAESAQRTLSDNNGGVVARAFRCLLRNRIQRAGIIAPGAGFLRLGENGKGLSSRWYPETLTRRIDQIVVLRSRIEFREGDALHVIRRYLNRDDAVFFVDPPYTPNGAGPGNRLYRYNEVDHGVLVETLSAAKGAVMITYQDCESARDLGRKWGFRVAKVDMRTAHHRKVQELLLVKDRCT